MFGKHGGKSTGKHPCTRQDLAAARRLQTLAIDELETAQKAVVTAQKAVDALQAVWLQREDGDNNEEAKQAYAKFKEAKDEVGKAKLEVEKAEAKVEKATEAVKASFQAGPEQAGASACATVAVAFDLHSRMVVCVFVRSTVVAFWGHALLSARIPLVVKLSPLCWLAALRGAGGAFGAESWLLQVSRKSGCPSCFTGCWCWQ